MTKILALLALPLLALFLFLRTQLFQPAEINLVGNAPSPLCSVPSFVADTPLSVPNFTYPALVKHDNYPYTLFIGGITSTLPPALHSLPNRTRYTLSQEEIWRLTSPDLQTWDQPQPSFTIFPETPVAFKGNRPYHSVYPQGFKTGCASLPNNQCNVQINDPSVVSYNNALYLYFSILENYRWYDGTLGSLKDGNPTNPAEQNRHSIGLAVSGDNGAHWAFVDKIIPENPKDAQGNSILGAWAPSAVVLDSQTVEVYFHDALGTKQYVATLKNGASLQSITRLNPNDNTYRTNLDVLKLSDKRLALYNDSSFNIVQTVFTTNSRFTTDCPARTIVPGGNGTLWPTPHQFVKDNRLHLYFWKFGEPNLIHHWSRPL